jgi:hypothetical protein
MDAVLGTHEGCNYDSDNQGDHICPHRQSDVLFRNHNDTENEAAHKDQTIPPPRYFRVVFGHVRVMAIVISPFFGTFVGPSNVFAPKEDTMNN